MACLNAPSSIASETASSVSWQTRFVISARRVTQITRIVRHASGSLGNTTGVDCIAEAATIDATTIYATMPTVDLDAMDATNATINFNTATATVEATARRDAMAMITVQRQERRPGQKARTKKTYVKIDATIAIEERCTIDARKSTCTISIATQTAMTRVQTTAKIRMLTRTGQGHWQIATTSTIILMWPSGH